MPHSPLPGVLHPVRVQGVELTVIGEHVLADGGGAPGLEGPGRRVSAELELGVGARVGQLVSVELGRKKLEDM